MALQPVNLDLTDRLRNHEFAVEYVRALEEQQRDSEGRYEKRIAELEVALRKVRELTGSALVSSSYQAKYEKLREAHETARRALNP